MKPTTFAEQAAALLKWLRVRTADGVVHLSCGAWMQENDGRAHVMCTVSVVGTKLLPPFVVEADQTPLTCLDCLQKRPR